MKKKSKIALPTELQTSILRRASNGGILCTMIDGEANFCYSDGAKISGTYNDIIRCIKNGWLIGEKDSMFDVGFSQKYMPRMVSS